jgi:release factor glutamine methyltransferase
MMTSVTNQLRAAGGRPPTTDGRPATTDSRLRATDRRLRAATERLRSAGCVAAEEEATELVAVAGADPARLRELLARRCNGEPLAWLTGTVRFCGEVLAVHPGVYVPRWQTEPLAREAVARLPVRGVAVDLCSGAGPIAALLTRRRPRARVLATEIDPVAARCARANGVDVLEGDLADPLPPALEGRVDVITAVPPYVPTGELRFLPRDVTAFEPLQALDGGPEGTRGLLRVVHLAARWLRPGGSLLIEVGGDQARLLGPVMEGHGYRDARVLTDEDGAPRAVACRLGPTAKGTP